MLEAWDSPDCLQWLVRMMDVLDSLITECGDHNGVTIPPPDKCQGDRFIVIAVRDVSMMGN